MVNSTVCPLCIETIGCHMDEKHAAIVKELLAACQEAIAATGGSKHWNGETGEFLKMMEQAIAKAEGNTCDAR